ncbi:DNA recombination/repair protein RecA [Paenarthrobacter ureafaciens]|uniref:DNA recombination/repair protein RecA n=1 Tax=Paenarthrobacter ureafaciens TaxID=37931 RepID=UPI001FB21D05|nr:DNA recombination/repair protein RecA [Paenarthrobacter ureafaciens]UOD81987.1 DNA recombination/repair protein RecA [Paenarthrobacter ureafaciens]WNZ05479.1 DNA recombination/repair protein RecA [Paenarthrobacter ureafaciens]
MTNPQLNLTHHIPEYFRADAYEERVPVPPPPMSRTRNSVIYADVAALLSGDMPPAPTPSVLRRHDGGCLFYSNQFNMLFGEAESAKTFVALAAMAETLRAGGTGCFLDMDHNGAQSIVVRLINFGVPADVLSDLSRFRFKEPEDRPDLIHTVADLKAWSPDVVVVDSVGELLPLMGLNSNSPDDFTIAHTSVLKPLATSGACVIGIDHVAKNTESKAQGPTGTVAKARAVGGVMLRVTVKESYSPGNGGSSYLNIKKDRHGGLRANSPSGDKEPLAGTFKMYPDSSYAVFAPDAGERMPSAAPAIDLATLKAMDPAPASVRDVKERLGWGTNRATVALKVFREAFPVPHIEGAGTGTPLDPSSASVPEEQGTGLLGEAA